MLLFMTNFMEKQSGCLSNCEKCRLLFLRLESVVFKKSLKKGLPVSYERIEDF